MRLCGAVFVFVQERQNQRALQQKTDCTIMCIGESTTALGGKDAWPTQLEEVLNERGGGRKFTVLNKALPGVNSADILAQLPQNLERCKPDIVVAMMGANDYKDAILTDTRPAGCPRFHQDLEAPEALDACRARAARAVAGGSRAGSAAAGRGPGPRQAAGRAGALRRGRSHLSPLHRRQSKRPERIFRRGPALRAAVEQFRLGGDAEEGGGPRPAQRPLLQRAGADPLEAGQVRRGGRGAASVYRVEPQSRRDLGRSGLLPREAGPERRGRGLPAQGGGVESDQSSHLRALRRFLRAPGEGSRARGTAHRRLAASAHQRHHRGPPRAVLVAAGRWGEGRALVSQGRRPAGPARLSEHPRQLPASRAGADRAGHSPGVRAVPGPERGAATGSLRIRERPRLRRQREGVPPSSGDLALRGHLLGRLLRRFRALHAQGQPHPWPRTSPRPSWRWSCRAEPAAAPAFRRRHAGRPWAWPRNASDGLIAAAAAAPGRPSHRAAGYGAAPASCEWLWGTPPRRWRAVRCSPRASDRRARRTRP